MIEKVFEDLLRFVFPDVEKELDRAIFIFLNNYLRFEEKETNRIFIKQMDLLTGKKNTMGILEQLAEIRAQEGLEQGRQEGKEEANRLFVENLLRDSDFSMQKIAALANVSLHFVRNVKKGLPSKITA